MIILFLLFGKHHPSGIYSGTRGKHRSAPRGQCTRGTLYMAGPHVIFIQGCPSRGLAMSPSFPLGHGSPRGKIDLGSWPHQKKKIFLQTHNQSNPLLYASQSMSPSQGDDRKTTPPFTIFHTERLWLANSASRRNHSRVAPRWNGGLLQVRRIFPFPAPSEPSSLHVQQSSHHCPSKRRPQIPDVPDICIYSLDCF